MSEGTLTVPNLSEHLSSAETTAQLSARFAYAAAMKSMNNLLLLGDGESWSRQTVDFAGLPEMARTFLQVAAGAADIPVTRLLGQSPSGLSATGESDVRNYYDMIAARQELDLRPQLERLDRLICWSEDIDEGALTFAFRPLWQLDEPAKAALALSKAQATQVYAGLKLWPDALVARLAEAQLVQDGTYPNAAAVFAEAGATASAGTRPTLDFDPAQPRDLWGRWTSRGAGAGAPAGAAGMPGHTQGHAAQQPGDLSWLLSVLNPIGTAQAAEEPPERLLRREGEPAEPAELEPDEVMRIRRFEKAWKTLKELDPDHRAPDRLQAPGAIPTEAESEILERTAREIIAARTCSPFNPGGLPDELVPEPPRRLDPSGSDVFQSSLPRADPRASQQLNNALSDYRTRRYEIGNQVFQLDKAGMRHVLERHSLDFWNGRSEKMQTFFRPGTSIDDVKEIVGDVLIQNRNQILADPDRYERRLSGTRDGSKFGIAIYQGRVVQVVPSM